MLFEVTRCDVTGLDNITGEGARDVVSALHRLTQPDLQNPPTLFPGPNPVSIDRGDFPKLRMQPYTFAEKTDGTRYVFMAFDYHDRHVCVLFDRGLTPYLFPIDKCPRALYQGSVLDGELAVDDTGTRVFLVFDAIVVCGIPIFRAPFSQRLAAAATALTFYEYSPGDSAALEIKHFHPTYVPTGRFAVDGVILMPELDHVVFGRHNNLFKLKEKHTLDFLVKSGKLYVFDSKTRRNKVVGVPTGPHAHLAIEGSIVECVLDPASSAKCDRWIVLHQRPDKTVSNNKFTFDKTLLNIKERLTLADVVAAMQ